MKIAILHYSAPPVVGGVENVIYAHASLLLNAGHSVTVVAGDGRADALPPGTEFILIPELSTRHPAVAQASLDLEQGHLPENFASLVSIIEARLASAFHTVERVIAHNVFTKHFNLPFTAALCNLIDKGALPGCIAWCHDFTWTSPHSQSKVFPGYPWDILRTPHPHVRYVTVSQHRQQELSSLLGLPAGQIDVIYNGVEPQEVLGLSRSGMQLCDRLGIWNADLVLLMPVRVTQAKNIELAIHLAAALKERLPNPKVILTGPPDPHDQHNLEYFNDLLALRHELKVDRQMLFVYESGPVTGQPYTVDMTVVGDLYRVSDALFMPSHREGFGMPVVEAGLAGLPVFSTAVPAAVELGDQEVIVFSPAADPRQLAGLVVNSLEKNPQWRLRQRVRQGLTWQGIFNKDISPLLHRAPL